MRRIVYYTAGILWLSAICTVMGILWRYDNTAGISARPPSAWPSASKIQRTSGQATLVLLAHPHCPCTRATIGELALIMAHCQGKLSAYVLFYKPIGFPEGWEKSDLWWSAAAIPGVYVLCDADGGEARKFHAATSGETVVYDATGRVVFQGGITGSRGHAGDNAGRSAIVELLTGTQVGPIHTPVFGCALLGATSKGKE